jgi:heterodisulfide reductase subunit B
MNRHFRTHYQMPILFFTQLIGLAFGLESKALGIGSEIVSARAALGRIGIEVPQPDEEPVPAGPATREGRRPKRSERLPMPRLIENDR